MKKIATVVFGILLGVSSGRAVSRVGGGKVRSQASGFEATLPMSFAQMSSISADSVRAIGSVVYIAGVGPVTQFIDISEFATEFPDAVGLSPEQLKQRLGAAQWTERSLFESCILKFENRTSNKIAAIIVTWGQGHGFVLKGPRLPDVENAMQSFLQTLKIDGEGCAWH